MTFMIGESSLSYVVL